MKKALHLLFVIMTLFLVCILSGCGQKGGEKLNLFTDGESEYVIVRSAEATDSEKRAATELQLYLYNMTGKNLPVVKDDAPAVEKEIIVGKTNREKADAFDRDELGEDGFIIKTQDSKLWLVGGGDRGTIYSVFAFLEDYAGCGFYTEEVEKVPKTDTISVGIKEDKQIPAFTCRGVRAPGYMTERISVRRRLNYELAGRDLSEQLGGGFDHCQGIGGHTFELLVDPKMYFKFNPEYFSMNAKGRRISYKQLCLTNEDVFELIVQGMKRWLAEDPDADIIALSPNDTDGACLCEECRAIYEEEGGAYSATLIRFVNAVAKELAKDYPDLKVITSAYSYTRSAPTKTKPADNVIVNFATMGTCFRHPNEDQTCKISQTPTYMDGSHTSITEDFAAWSEICEEGQLFIRDYSTNFFYPVMTFPDFDTLRENISYFAKSNAAGIEVESSLRTDGEFGQLRSYLLSKLFWEPDMSEEEYEGYMDEFLTEVYGEGGTYLRQYIELANEVTEDICFDLSPACSKVFPIPTVKNHEKGELPEKLTVEMLKDYEDVEWTPYWNWYTDVKENRITSEGTKLFEKAMESAETKEQKNRIAKASAQVGYIKSYYLYECIQAGGVKQMITTFINEHADEFSKAEQKNLANKIEKMAKRQMEKEYAEYNYDLCKDMVEAGITHTGVSLEKWQQLDFANIPSAW